MTELIDTRDITCPHCGEAIEIVIDLSVASQSYIEDCSVCCRPIAICVVAENGEIIELGAEAAE